MIRIVKVILQFHTIVMYIKLLLWLCTLYLCQALMYDDETKIDFKKQPADGRRCGICPTYFHKLCAFDFNTNETYIFDNLCIMDLYNCIHGTEFTKMNYENCLYFGNFAYVHGLKYEDYDYEEDHFSITHSKKNPDFA